MFKNLEVVTLRMHPDEIKALDDLASSYYYYKRSDMIRAAVQFFTKVCPKRAQYQIIASYGNGWKKGEYTIEYKDLYDRTERYAQQQPTEHQKG